MTTEPSGIFSGSDPLEITRRWMEEAALAEPSDPGAMALATCDAGGMPNVRMVLLREILSDGLVFYTNFGSKKARELAAFSHAAGVLHWKSLRRQIRVRGGVARAGDERADSYFASRPLQSRFAAWTSRQSAPLSSRKEMLERFEQIRNELGPEPSRPHFWGGFKILPTELEFWSDGDHRLHDRVSWKKHADGDRWTTQRLWP